jgi:hypothetical protein
MTWLDAGCLDGQAVQKARRSSPTTLQDRRRRRDPTRSHGAAEPESATASNASPVTALRPADLGPVVPYSSVRCPFCRQPRVQDRACRGGEWGAGWPWWRGGHGGALGRFGALMVLSLVVRPKVRKFGPPACPKSPTLRVAGMLQREGKWHCGYIGRDGRGGSTARDRARRARCPVVACGGDESGQQGGHGGAVAMVARSAGLGRLTMLSLVVRPKVGEFGPPACPKSPTLRVAGMLQREGKRLCRHIGRNGPGWQHRAGPRRACPVSRGDFGSHLNPNCASRRS